MNKRPSGLIPFLVFLGTGGGGGSITANGFGFRGTNVNQWFVAGTNGDVLDAICIQ